MGYMNRFRQSYVSRRSRRQSACALLVLAAIGVTLGVAGRHDEQDREAVSRDNSPGLRRQVVATWSEPSIPEPLLQVCFAASPSQHCRPAAGR